MSMVAPELESLQLHHDQELAELRITLDRPSTLNAWGPDLGNDLIAALAYAKANEQVRIVTITGSGRAFCSGADLGAGISTNAVGELDIRGALRDRYHPVILTLRELPKPVIAAVNGPAVGIGCSLAIACDLIVAAQSAYFQLSFVRLGLIPDGGCSLLLPARVGMTRATEMAMLGERVTAEQALDWGLANRVFTNADFEGELKALVERMSNGSPESYAGSKQAINAALLMQLGSQLEFEGTIQQQCANKPAFAQAVTAFLSKSA